MANNNKTIKQLSPLRIIKKNQKNQTNKKPKLNANAQQVELNQNGQIEVKETPNPNQQHEQQQDEPDGETATVLSIHEHTNGSIPHDPDTYNSTSLDDSAIADITADIADAEQLNNAIDVVQKENGLNNSINADTAAVGFSFSVLF